MNKHTPTDTPSYAQLQSIADHLPALVLTGAGVSAGAGIPTYRDKQGTWLRSDPITHQSFLGELRARQKYWGRSMLGWPAVRDARPASAHLALAALEERGHLCHLVTQNVDRLHQRAGSQGVTDLHGRLDRVICLSCGTGLWREALQQRLQRLNAHLHAAAVQSRPDGDADLPEDIVDTVQIPSCESCGGVLMPDVVFFGGSIPRERVTRGQQALQRARSLLVIGSSLQVYSGYRFCRWAKETGKPLFIVNPGVTRADSLAREKLPQTADVVLEQLLTLLGSHPGTIDQRVSTH